MGVEEEVCRTPCKGDGGDWGSLESLLVWYGESEKKTLHAPAMKGLNELSLFFIDPVDWVWHLLVKVAPLLNDSFMCGGMEYADRSKEVWPELSIIRCCMN
jgi:hypothetical protein